MPSRTRNKSKDEIAEQMKNIQHVKELRAFVKEKFYPALLTASTSIDDAKFLLSSFSSMVMEQFLGEMKKKQFIELKLHEKLDKNSPNYKAYVDMLTLFGDKNVYEARELIEGMKAEVELMVNNELKDRKLETLKTNFLD